MASSFVDDQFQFAEMNIRHTGNMTRTLAMVRRAIRMGYDCIVINTDIGHLTLDVTDLVIFLFSHWSAGSTWVPD